MLVEDCDLVIKVNQENPCFDLREHAFAMSNITATRLKIFLEELQDSRATIDSIEIVSDESDPHVTLW